MNKRETLPIGSEEWKTLTQVGFEFHCISQTHLDAASVSTKMTSCSAEEEKPNKNRIDPPQDWLEPKPEFHAIHCLLLRHKRSVCPWGVCQGFPLLCGTLLPRLFSVESPSLYKRHWQPSSVWPSGMTESVELLVFKRFTAHQEKQRNLGALAKPPRRDKRQTASENVENVGFWHRNAAGWVL